MEHYYVNTSDALSSKQIRFQVLPKLFGFNSWIPQMMRQLFDHCCAEERDCLCITLRQLYVHDS